MQTLAGTILAECSARGVAAVPAPERAASPVGPETARRPDQAPSNGGNRGVGPVAERQQSPEVDEDVLMGESMEWVLVRD